MIMAFGRLLVSIFAMALVRLVDAQAEETPAYDVLDYVDQLIGSSNGGSWSPGIEGSEIETDNDQETSSQEQPYLMVNRTQDYSIELTISRNGQSCGRYRF